MNNALFKIYRPRLIAVITLISGVLFLLTYIFYPQTQFFSRNSKNNSSHNYSEKIETYEKKALEKLIIKNAILIRENERLYFDLKNHKNYLKLEPSTDNHQPINISNVIGVNHVDNINSTSVKSNIDILTYNE